MKLSVCLITRNEEDPLPQALRSVAGLGDEVIVGDTGSTDRTVEIARELGATVHDIGWENDFAAARNAALERATGDWVLWLNPDEEVLPIDWAALRSSLTNEHILAYAVRIQQVTRAEDPGPYTETGEVRLFRRLPELRYTHRLHPTFAVSLDDVARRLGQDVLPSALTLRHHAYLSVLTPGKLRWALRLLELELRDRPDQLEYRIEYGRTLLLLNDAKGHEVLAEAAEKVRELRDAPRPPNPMVGQLLEYLLTVSPEQSRSRWTRDEVCELAVRWFPETPPVLWRAAEHCFRSGDMRRAVVLLERLVQCGQTGRYDRSAPFDPSIIGEPALMNLGVAYLRLGDANRAEACLRQLQNSPTSGATARQHLQKVEALRRGSPRV